MVVFFGQLICFDKYPFFIIGADMSLQNRVEDELHIAIKNRDELKVSTLRMLKADIMYEKNKTGADLDDAKVLEVISRAAKKRKESIAEFTKASRDDLAEREKNELSIISSYLPKQMTEEEIESFIDKKISENGLPASTEKGKFMGMLMKELKGVADGNTVKQIFENKISK